MKDQWSGNTLLSAPRVKLPAPTRSSTHRVTRLITAAIPEPRPDRLREVPERDQVAALVDADRELRQWSRRGAAGRRGPLHDRERGLMARTEQLARVGLVQPDGTSGVRAHLRE